MLENRVSGRAQHQKNEAAACATRKREGFTATMGVSRLTTTTISSAAFVSCCFLLHVSAERAREPFNGAVHTEPGHDTADDGMTETPFSDADWKNINLSAKFVTRKSWQAGLARGGGGCGGGGCTVHRPRGRTARLRRCSLVLSYLTHATLCFISFFFFFFFQRPALLE